MLPKRRIDTACPARKRMRISAALAIRATPGERALNESKQTGVYVDNRPDNAFDIKIYMV